MRPVDAAAARAQSGEDIVPGCVFGGRRGGRPVPANYRCSFALGRQPIVVALAKESMSGRWQSGVWRERGVDSKLATTGVDRRVWWIGRNFADSRARNRRGAMCGVRRAPNGHLSHDVSHFRGHLFSCVVTMHRAVVAAVGVSQRVLIPAPHTSYHTGMRTVSQNATHARRGRAPSTAFGRKHGYICNEL